MQNRKFPHADTGGSDVGVTGRDVDVGAVIVALGNAGEGIGIMGRVGASVGAIVPGVMGLVDAAVSVPRMTTRGVTGGKVRDALPMREG